jgi:hypothetical protein
MLQALGMASEVFNFPVYRTRIHLSKDHFCDPRSTAIRDLASCACLCEEKEPILLSTANEDSVILS